MVILWWFTMEQILFLMKILFNKNAIGSANDEGFYGYGYYFTTNYGSSYYGRNVKKFYLKIERPFEIGNFVGTIQESFLHTYKKLKGIGDNGLIT